MRRLVTVKKPKRIVVRMPNWLGDVVMATPCLQDIKQAFPDASVTAMCQGAVGDLIQGNPYVDQILRFKKISGWVHTALHPNLLLPLKKEEFDLGVLLTNSFSSAYWFWRAGVKERYGFATHCRSLLLNHPVQVPKDIEERHLVEIYKDLLIPLGISPSDTLPRLYVSPEEKKVAKDRLDGLSFFLGKK